ncbi:MAG: hypothetical protein WC584_03630 [Candidatus Pacearchaeota archaeon]
MTLKDYLEELSQGEVGQVRQILSEPHFEEGFLKRTFQQRKFYVINDLINILGEDEALKNILVNIKVDEELRRIRNGYECATCLPENYLKAISDAFGQWGIVSFYRGRWEIKNPDLSEDLPRISMKHIYTGSNKLRKAFKKNPLQGDLNFILEGQWKRIDNSYDIMFNDKSVPRNYYDLENRIDSGEFEKSRRIR